MKKWLPWLCVVVFGGEALIMALVLANAKPKPGAFDAAGFGKLPVLLNGRIQPLDSVARNTLLQMRSTQDVPLEEVPSWQFWKHPKKLKPTEWLLETLMHPEKADDRRAFLIHHPDLLTTLELQGKGAEKSGLHYFSFNEIKHALQKIEELGRQASGIKAELQTPFQKQAFKLHNAVILYHIRLRNSLRPPGFDDMPRDLAAYERTIAPGVKAILAERDGKEFDKAAGDRLREYLERFDYMTKVALPLMVPPENPETARDNWTAVGASLMESVRGGGIPPAIGYYAEMASAYRQGRPDDFNRALGEYRAYLAPKFAKELSKGRQEFFFNNIKPFLRALLIYIFAFLLGCASWFTWSEALRRSALWLVFVGFLIHTAGLVTRMVLEGRPPVTNLYSSAIFIGWGAVVLGMVLERIYKDGIGVVVAAMLGLVTQLIAHNLALGGDTMEMLQAVLDTNFWLATHVVVITLGYASTFMAGFLALVYIARGVFTRGLTPDTSKSLARMVYGIVCFATLFSFVGTVLGGIWADQSWGRFWGWDPKENGALLIVLWNATILHARWGGMIRERGLMNMAIFGNIVTAFSWFGVNMLGIGLHSYGFMDAAFFWLMLFNATQLIAIGLGLLPPRYWASLRNAAESVPQNPPGGKSANLTKPKPA